MTIPPVQVPPPMLAYQQPTPPPVPAGWTNVKIYGYLPHKVGAFTRERTVRLLVLRCISVMVMAAVMSRLLAMNRTIALEYIFFLVVVVLVSGAYRVWRLRRTIARQWPTFRIYLADQGVCRICQDFPNLTLTYDGIKEIRDVPGKGLLIKGRRQQDVLLLAADYIENYQDLRQQLASVVPFKSPARLWLLVTRNVTLILLYVGLFLASYLIGLYATDWRVEAGCLGLMVVTIGVVQYFTWRSPNITIFQKLASLLVWLFPVALTVKIAFHLFY